MPESRLPPSPISDGFLDAHTDAWVLSRYADVLMALGDKRLYPTDPQFSDPKHVLAERQRLENRRATIEALAPAKLAEWRGEMQPFACDLLEKVPTNQPVDLVEAFLRPWCLRLATIVTDTNPSDADRLCALAKQVSLATAKPGIPALRTEASNATALMQPHFQSGPQSLRESGFVALSQTLPCFLANVWHALFSSPSAGDSLRLFPDLLPRAIEELIRVTSFSRTIYRIAVDDVQINGFTIARGQRAILRLNGANMDPAQFDSPEQLNLGRSPVRHLSFGSGPHSCTGASLIRMAAIVVTGELLKNTSRVDLCGPTVWEGGAGFQWPEPLVVCLTGEKG